MNGCALPISVKLPDCMNKTEFMGCNLNPVVVLTDFRKSLSSSSASPAIDATPEPKTKTRPISTASTKSFKISSPRATQVQHKSMKRKRESWDPSVEYEIEKIVGYHRDKRKKLWYYVKWKNWPNDYNTFEPIDNLTGCHYKLMKFFETDLPSSQEIKKMNSDLKTELEKRDIYKRLADKTLNSEHMTEFSRECPDAHQFFDLSWKALTLLNKRISREYRYIVRCLIGMYSHKDPGLMIRGQNYRFLLILTQYRLEQLRKITKAEKKINNLYRTEIEIENKVDLDHFPDINYITEMKSGTGVELAKEPLLGCECVEGCSPKSRCCGVLGDSEFAYTMNGKLKTTAERFAIYECNKRCSCPAECPNRVVQRGRQVKLCIFKTKSCGWGVKAGEKIQKGTFVCEYIGELISDSEAVVRDVRYFSNNRSGYLFDLDFFTDPKLDMYCIDATEHGNVARFINHSCDPNLVVYPVWIDEIEPNKHRLAFFARRNIQKGEEIQFDYENLEELPADDDDSKKSHGLRMISNVRCQCNAANCREWIFGNR